jgi:hypothetical protein
MASISRSKRFQGEDGLPRGRILLSLAGVKIIEAERRMKNFRRKSSPAMQAAGNFIALRHARLDMEESLMVSGVNPGTVSVLPQGGIWETATKHIVEDAHRMVEYMT